MSESPHEAGVPEWTLTAAGLKAKLEQAIEDLLTALDVTQ